jgi:tetratricopeptide (TPR) repeat protein
VALAPDDQRLWHNLGPPLYNLQRYDEALAAYERALELEPDDVRALQQQGEVLVKLGRLDDAVHASQRSLALVPEHGVAPRAVHGAVNCPGSSGCRWRSLMAL